MNNTTPQIKTEIMRVTPEIAALFLKKNQGNRSISKPRVAELTQSLLKKEWKLTHQGIAFSSEDRLLDGQHRLSAIIAADTAAEMMVSWNVPDHVFSVIDCGFKRNLSDRAGLPRCHTEILAFLLRISRGSANRNHVGIHEIKRLFDPLQNLLVLINDYAPARTKALTGSPIRSALLVAIVNDSNPFYALDLYRKFSIWDSSDLPPIGHSVLKQAATGAISSAGGSDIQLTNYARIRVAFREENKHKERLVLTAEGKTNAILEISKFVEETIGGVNSGLIALAMDDLKKKIYRKAA